MAISQSAFPTRFAIATAVLVASLQAVEVRGHISDETNAIVAGAVVTVTGTAKHTTTTNRQGEYRLPDLAPGIYKLTAVAPQLQLEQPLEFTVGKDPIVLDLKLKLSIVTQSVNVDDAATAPIGTDTRNNPAELVLRGQDLEVLGDKPEDLAADLMALAGPSAGPNGGAIFVDGL